jgi:hypothetical protein
MKRRILLLGIASLFVLGTFSTYVPAATPAKGDGVPGSLALGALFSARQSRGARLER